MDNSYNYEHDTTLEELFPMPKVTRKVNMTTVAKHTTAYYCKACDESYKFWDKTCPKCEGPTIEQKIKEAGFGPQVHSYREWYDARSKKYIRSYDQEKKWMKKYDRIDTRDTGHMEEPMFKEKIKEYKWKIQRGIVR